MKHSFFHLFLMISTAAPLYFCQAAQTPAEEPFSLTPEQSKLIRQIRACDKAFIKKAPQSIRKELSLYLAELRKHTARNPFFGAEPETDSVFMEDTETSYSRGVIFLKYVPFYLHQISKPVLPLVDYGKGIKK